MLLQRTNKTKQNRKKGEGWWERNRVIFPNLYLKCMKSVLFVLIFKNISESVESWDCGGTPVSLRTGDRGASIRKRFHSLRRSMKLEQLKTQMDKGQTECHNWTLIHCLQQPDQEATGDTSLLSDSQQVRMPALMTIQGTHSNPATISQAPGLHP